MLDIRHEVGIRTDDADEVFAALTTIEGLAGWWTTDTTGDGDVGGTLRFRFPSGGFAFGVPSVVGALCASHVCSAIRISSQSA